MKATKVRAGLYRYGKHEIEFLAGMEWKDYQGLWRVWDEESEPWYMHYTTLKAAKAAIDEHKHECVWKWDIVDNDAWFYCTECKQPIGALVAEAILNDTETKETR